MQVPTTLPEKRPKVILHIWGLFCALRVSQFDRNSLGGSTGLASGSIAWSLGLGCWVHTEANPVGLGLKGALRF